MSLSGALAGLLLAGPSHGYELHATLEAELGPGWVTRASQVYLTLGRMARDGYVTSERIHQQTRPDRQLLRITETGRDLAAAWFERGPADELVARIAVARLVRPDQLSSLVFSMIDERTEVLHRLRAERGRDSGGFRAEARDAEVRAVEAQVRWLNGLVGHLDDLATRPRARPADEPAAELA